MPSLFSFDGNNSFCSLSPCGWLIHFSLITRECQNYSFSKIWNILEWMDSSSGYASINMSTSMGSPKKPSKKLSFWTPKTPEGGLKAFKCQSRALWLLIIASAIVIEYDRLCTQENFVTESFTETSSRCKSAIYKTIKSLLHSGIYFWTLLLFTKFL